MNNENERLKAKLAKYEEAIKYTIANMGAFFPSQGICLEKLKEALTESESDKTCETCDGKGHVFKGKWMVTCDCQRSDKPTPEEIVDRMGDPVPQYYEEDVEKCLRHADEMLSFLEKDYVLPIPLARAMTHYGIARRAMSQEAAANKEGGK